MSGKVGITFTANDDWERLTQIVSKEALTNIAKHDKHLQQQEFRGQRTTHISWDKAHRNIVARHAPSCTSTRNSLVKSFSHTYGVLREQIEKITSDNLEEDIIKVLANIGFTEQARNALLWALILDEREEIQQALENGLRAQLADETSQLVMKAELYKVKKDLERTQQELSELRVEKQAQDDKIKQIPALQATIEQLQKQVSDLNIQCDTREQALREARGERDKAVYDFEIAQKEVQELQTTVASQQEHHNKYMQNTEHLQTEVEEKRQQIASVSTERDQLKQAIKKAEQAKIEAYGKRDEEYDRSQKLEESLAKLEHAKEILVTQIRSLNRQLEDVKEGIVDEQLSKQIPEVMPDFDRTWRQAIADITNQVQVTLEVRNYPRHSVSSQEKLEDWLHWQQAELELVTSLLSSRSVELVDLSQINQAQRLLVLRWYLLEWFKLTVAETLAVNSAVLQKQKGYKK